MKTIFLHSEYSKVIPKKVAIKIHDKNPKELSINKEHLLLFICFEKGDNTNLFKKLLDEIKKYTSNLKLDTILIYPWAHLSNNLCDAKTAKDLLDSLVKYIEKNTNLKVYKAPFGWYKAFEIKIKGHPLAELSREFKGESSEEIYEKETKFYILYPDGTLEEVSEEKLNKFEEEFQILIKKEALKIPYPELNEENKNPYLSVFKKFGFEWEPLSDYGHMRYGPLATEIFKEVEKYSREVIKDFSKKAKIKIYEIKGTSFFNLQEPPVKEHSKLFGERLYSVASDKGNFVLRYAACFQQFSMVKDWILSYKDLPFGTFEIADSYRFEQSGECTLCFRLRRFYMPDLHIYCKTIRESMKIVLKVQKKILEEWEKKLGFKVVLLLNVSKEKYLNKYKKFFTEVAKILNRPILINVIVKGPEYYWIANAEFHIVDAIGRVREIGTWQIDIGNSKRFGIRYYDKDNKEKYPIILHISFLGSIERYIYGLFTKALISKNKPSLPFRFSPVQIAVIPIKKEHKKLAKKLEKLPYRIEIDENFDESLGKRILKYEKLWTPIIVIIGDKEYENKIYTVRIRNDSQKQMSFKELKKFLDSFKNSF